MIGYDYHISNDHGIIKRETQKLTFLVVKSAKKKYNIASII